MQERYTFRKCERISSRRLFQLLMEKGKHFRCGFLRFTTVSEIPEALVTSSLMVAFAVPKRQFPRAVDRNKIKRRMREAWRKNKNSTVKSLEAAHKQLCVLIKYELRELKPQAEIQEHIVAGLKKIQERI